MPADDLDIGYAIGLPPEQAIEYFESKGVVAPRWNWQQTWQHANARAFTVAKAIKAEVLTDIRAGLIKAKRQGLTERQFIEELEPLLKKRGWWGRQEVFGPDGQLHEVQLGNPYRLRTIFQTNMATSFAAARYQSAKGATDEFPFWRYDAMDDMRTRPAHAALDGLVFRHDDPFWDTHYPPNGFNCRCRIVAMTEADLEESGLDLIDGSKHLEPVAPRPGELDPETGELLPERPTRFALGNRVMVPDPGWNYNPGKAGLGQLQELDIRKTEKRLRQAKAAGHLAETTRITHRSFQQGWQSTHFREFLEKTSATDRHQWPVATIAATRLKQMGLPDNARVVRLRSDSVSKGHHRERYLDFSDKEWSIIQEVLDSGGAMPIRDDHGAIWHQASDGKWWLVIVGHGENGAFLETAYPARRNYIDKKIRKWTPYSENE